MLLVATVVVAHPLRIAHHRSVVAGDLQMLGEGMAPLRGRHHPPSPFPVMGDEQQGGLGDGGLGLHERFDAPSGPGELGEMQRHRVVDLALRTPSAATATDPVSNGTAPKPSHVAIMTASGNLRGG